VDAGTKDRLVQVGLNAYDTICCSLETFKTLGQLDTSLGTYVLDVLY
jgi:hypothetical protein